MNSPRPPRRLATLRRLIERISGAIASMRFGSVEEIAVKEISEYYTEEKAKWDHVMEERFIRHPERLRIPKQNDYLSCAFEWLQHGGVISRTR